MFSHEMTGLQVSQTNYGTLYCVVYMVEENGLTIWETQRKTVKCEMNILSFALPVAPSECAVRKTAGLRFGWSCSYGPDVTLQRLLLLLKVKRFCFTL